MTTNDRFTVGGQSGGGGQGPAPGLQVPPGSGNLVFRDPRPGVINSFCKGAMANGYSDVRLKPDAGLLVLFPHWLEHYVEPHAGEGPRMVIAFNALRP
jgi:hypothetical protein